MNDQLVEGVHFYREGPYVVFTEKYLKERGYCCESGCRHCPFGYRKDQRSEAPVSPAPSTRSPRR
ncbi:MAG TPA: DUF5522 domain-containing protein [Thermoanaerobaculia bacterium]|nr:DUF5522 domain-containing protein [Thermoanaerobaculia bacterium]